MLCISLWGRYKKKMRKDLNMSIANFRDYIITLCKLNLIDEEICNKLEESKDVLNDALSSYECKFIEMLKKYNLEYKKEPLYRDYIKDCKDKKRFDFLVYYNNNEYFIEIFGLLNEEYFKKTVSKIKMCIDNNIKLIDLYPDDIRDSTLDELHDLLMKKISKL